MGTGSIRRFLKQPTSRMFWWFDHMQGMIASYIAAMTAFSAVNLSHWFGPAWWVWLWPTIVGVPAIVVPAGFCPDGLPFGLEIAARPWRDGDLIGWAYGFEQATRERRAPVLVEKGLLAIGR